MAQVVSILRETRLFTDFSVRVIVTHKQGGALKRGAIYVRAMTSFLGVLVTRQAALVHAHVAAHGSFWRKSTFLTLARIFRVPTILHLHASQIRDFYERDCGPFQRRVIRHVLEHASTVIVLSKRLQAYIGTIAPLAKTVTIHNFVDMARIEAETKRTSVERSSTLLLFLGDIGHRKGIHDLIRALPADIEVNTGGSARRWRQGRYRCSAAERKGARRRKARPSAGICLGAGKVSPACRGRDLRSSLLQRRCTDQHPGSDECGPSNRYDTSGRDSGRHSGWRRGISGLARINRSACPQNHRGTEAARIFASEWARTARRRLRTEYSPEVSLGALMALYQSHGAQLLPGAGRAANTPVTDS